MAKSLEEQLAAAQERVAKLQTRINSEAIVNNVAVGNDVEFTFGRGEKKRTLRGVVTATREDEKLGKLAAVTVGEGFDVETYKVRFADITTNHSAEAETQPEGDPSNED